METRIFHLHALSALHVGTGQRVGAVDLPIARARATNLPLVPGSALKGVLRDEAKEKWGLNDKQIKTLFGAEHTDDNSHAGAIALGDAHLLLLPIRSFAGTVAYATCPFILKRYARDVSGCVVVPELKQNQAMIAANSKLIVAQNKIALEDLDIPAQVHEQATQWAKEIAQLLYPNDVANAETWRTQLEERFVILPDDIFSFLADTATEIRMRIRIERETRIVKQGNLWSEENLPAESVLWGVMGIGAARRKNGETAEELSKLIQSGETSIQIGGKHTVGRGLCRLLVK